MKQFTYKDYDIATGIVFTNLCCDMLNRFDIDMFNDPQSKTNIWSFGRLYWK